MCPLLSCCWQQEGVVPVQYCGMLTDAEANIRSTYSTIDENPLIRATSDDAGIYLVNE